MRAAPPQAGARGPVEFKGLSVNPGKVAACICLYSQRIHKSVKEYSLGSEEEAKREMDRFEAALQHCSDELTELSISVAGTIGKAEAEIFKAQRVVMNDPAISEAVRHGVMEDRKNLEFVISRVIGTYEDRFSKLDNEYLRDRSTDLGEIRRRLLDHLQQNESSGFICRGHPNCVQGRKRIVVAEELTADMMVHLDMASVRGIVTERGGPASHAAIIARSMGIPAVTAAHGLLDSASCGDMIFVDGDGGRVVLNPDEKLLSETVASEAESAVVLASPAGVEVMANASLMEDVAQASVQKADGIGLFRTEIEFIRQERLIPSDEQFAIYRQVALSMAGRPVVFRTLDVGGDKSLPFLRIEKEENPSLGWRGSRFLLGNRDILEAQLRALVRLGRDTTVSIMFPMVIDAPQMRELADFTRSVAGAEGVSMERIRLGAMFEVPSACVQAESILSAADFGSIGSNDLIQYLFAVDRNNELVSQSYDPGHPVLWEVMERLSASARRAGKPLSICGEIAGRHEFPTRLVSIGINSLSVSPRLIPRVRQELLARNGGAAAAAGGRP